MESKPNFAKVHGPWWTQIKVVLIQKGLMDNQNPGFCMGWPGLYLLDNINQLGSVCKVKVSKCIGKWQNIGEHFLWTKYTSFR